MRLSQSFWTVVLALLFIGLVAMALSAPDEERRLFARVFQLSP